MSKKTTITDIPRTGASDADKFGLSAYQLLDSPPIKDVAIILLMANNEKGASPTTDGASILIEFSSKPFTYDASGLAASDPFLSCRTSCESK